MKMSKILHGGSVLVGVAGVVALVGAYSAGANGTALGFSQNHLFIDAGIGILIAIWLQLATVHHMMLEKKGEVV